MLWLKVAFLTGLVEALVITKSPSLIPLEGCLRGLPHDQSVGKVANVTITSGGLLRYFLISIPPTYQAEVPTPAILSFHGGLRTAEDQLQLDQLTNAEFNTHSFVIYPQGVNDTWQGVPGIKINDLQFTTDILNHVQSQYCIDSARIYATGKSDGGGFCNVLACDPVLSHRIAAFAPVSGAFYIDTLPCEPNNVPIPCHSSRNDIPLLEFHGGNDTTINYQGGERKKECLPSIPHFIQQWAMRNRLGLHNVTSKMSSNTVSYKFGTGANIGMVEHVYDAVIGHDWPSTEPNADNQVVGHHIASFNATPMILDFFKQHPLNFWELLSEV